MRERLIRARVLAAAQLASASGAVRTLLDWTLEARAELLQAAGLLGGWALLTYGVVAFTTPKVWPVSVGLLLLSVCGWGWIGALFWRGLYALTQQERR